MKIKTIQYQRTRKINPALISPKYQYGSEEISFGAWADLQAGESEEEAAATLKTYIDEYVKREIANLVKDLREKANCENYCFLAIATAFSELMKTQNLPIEEINIALGRFIDLLNQKQAETQV
jgi:hypothetical protein